MIMPHKPGLARLSASCTMTPWPMILWCLFICLGVTAQPPALWARSSPSDIGRTIERKQEEMKTHERLLRGLSEQERKLFGDLQQVEARIRTSEAELAALEQELGLLRQTEQDVQAQYRELDLVRGQTVEELQKLLTVLWPVHVHGLEQKVQNLGAWDHADRQFAWLGRVYELVQERLAALQVQGRELAQAQARAEQARERIATQQELINAAKDELLTQKLSVVHRVQEVRAQKLSAEEQLKDVLQAIIELNYQLKLLTAKTFTDFKGQMPWPGQGTLAEGFRPDAVPPHRGISLSMAENAPVRAISWGKVVHSDVLRGYGHVVIVYHGEDYYTLYAFLSNVLVRVGQELEKDEQIGQAGHYPKVDGPGMYFELRFHQNPVNPIHWLAAM